ncbi:MAG: gliding motility-associated C-terminal domain-containing protein, partial [Candidatus Cloacimonetes bacterium]|nr:gliding motility-associated C-terminal domain-containing protein [Candidatus Cloacimonadota bacterium]
GLTSNEIRSLALIQESGTLLIGSNGGGINRWRDNGFLMPISEIIGLASNRVLQVAYHDSLIIAATTAGLSVFRADPSFPFPILLNNFTPENGPQNLEIVTLAIDDESYLYCGGSNGLDVVHLDSLTTVAAWRNYHTGNSILPGNRINSLDASGGKLLAGTDNGLIMAGSFAELSGSIPGGELYFEGESIFPVWLDPNDNIWLGFGYWEESLMNIIDSTALVMARISGQGDINIWEDTDFDLPRLAVMGFALLDDDICCYTWGNGLLIMEQDTWSQPYASFSLISNLVKDIAVDSNDRVWISDGYFGLEPSSKGTRGISAFDGEQWLNFAAPVDPLLSNNVISIDVDTADRIWFGCWQLIGGNPGVTVLDQSGVSWLNLTSSDGLLTSYITHINIDDEDKKWICSYGGGFNILDESDNVFHQFQLPQLDGQNGIISKTGELRSMFGTFYSGLRIWDSSTLPVTDGPHWQIPPFSELRNGEVYDIIIFTGKYGREEYWVASPNGLFQYAWSTYFNSAGEYLWFKYGTVIKKKAFINGTWFDEATPEFWYIEGQERLFGSQPTYPTALFIDPFGMIWIGTDAHGITMYNPVRETFTNFYQDNSPLISDQITAFGYQVSTGTLFIGTNAGMNSVEIGISAEANTETELQETLVYPNPFYPDQGDILRIENMNKTTMPKAGTECRIYDLAGSLVIVLAKDIYEQFSWDGLNNAGKKCSSGLYFYVVSTPDGQTARGKFALIR